MKNIFEPSSLGTLVLKNRIIRAATHEGMGHADGTPTDDLLKTYRSLSAGGVGGGICLKSNSRATLTHVTISGNMASGSGGGMQNFSTFRPIPVRPVT